MSRDRLAALCNGRESIPFSRSVDVRVAHLRKLLEADTNDPKLIQTVWNLGYVFTPQTE